MVVIMKPISTIKARLGLTPTGDVQSKLQDSCYRHMNKYVPYREGGLSKEVDLSNPKYIVYEMPYAHYMYIGEKYVMDNGKSAYYSPTYGFWSKKGAKKHPSGENLIYNQSRSHPYAGPYWDKRMVSAEIDEVIKEVQNYIGGKRWQKKELPK